LVIFDCNGVLVDSEPIAAAVLADAFKRIGITISADTVMRRFQGRRPSDIFGAVEAATNRKIPPNFPGEVAAETLHRLRFDLRAIAHAAHALTWIRGPKAVASSSSPERIRLSLEVTGLILFSRRGCSRRAPSIKASRRRTFSCSRPRTARPIRRNASWLRIPCPASPQRWRRA
jgi:beta-phosphoglucomutase-like phosphatase (HAD superfamily)